MKKVRAFFGCIITTTIILSMVMGVKNIVKATDGNINVETIFIKSNSIYLDTFSSMYMQAIVYPNNATNKEVMWSSSDTSIASINANTGGLTTKSKTGMVTITATAKDGSGVVGKIDFIVGGVNVKVGGTTTIGNSTYTSYKDVIWEIADETIACKTGRTGFTSINSNYKHSVEIKGVKNGQTTVNLRTISGDVLFSSNINVYTPIEDIICNINKLTLEKNETVNLNVDILPSMVSDNQKNIIYTSSDDSVVSVDQNGNVTAHNNGNATIVIYSQYNNKSLDIPVNVMTYTESLELDSYELNLNNKNYTHQILYTVGPENATNKNVKFESNNESVATVSSDGIITTYKSGNAIITVTTMDGKQTKDINVNVEMIQKDIRLTKVYDIENVPYTQTEIKPEIKIIDNDYKLVLNKDYIVEYKDNIEVGKATAIITGIGRNYKGTISKEFNIEIAQPYLSVVIRDTLYSSTPTPLIYSSAPAVETIISFMDSNYNELSNTPTEVGEYYVHVYQKYGPNYYDAEVTEKFKIIDKFYYLKGDLDENGLVNANDASITLDLFKNDSYTDKDIIIGDMDGNGILNANDASLILDYFKNNG